MRSVVLVLLASLLVALPAPACGPARRTAAPAVTQPAAAVVVTPATPVVTVAFVPSYGAGYVPQAQPAPKAAPQTMPPAEPEAAAPVGSPVVARCASCHGADAARKGRGVRMESWNVEDAVSAVDAGTMPRGAKLTPREKAEVILELTKGGAR